MWGFSTNKTRNLSLKAWDSFCLPKVLGGHGLRKMREVTLALSPNWDGNFLTIQNPCRCPNCIVSI
jgi:hypothetical protein